MNIQPLSEPWSYRRNLAPMPWSLGIVADLAWNIFPELRPSMRDLIMEHIDRAILVGEHSLIDYGDEAPHHDQLSLPESPDYLVHIVRPAVLDGVANGTATADLINRLCKYLRLLLTYAGEESAIVTTYAEEIVEDIGTPAGRAGLASADPELAGFIRGRLGIWQP